MKRFIILSVFALFCVNVSAGVRISTVDIPYITKLDTVDVRQVEICMPEDAVKPVPVVFIPHYHAEADSRFCMNYLEQGWAVVSPILAKSMNGTLSDDNLVFNNAVLHYIRHQDEFDNSRIVLSGRSAGGYTALMIASLQLGVCATLAESPLINLFFNFKEHFSKAAALNDEAVDNPPFPVIGSIQSFFLKSLDNFPDADDIGRWESLSPIGLAKCICCPVLIDHYTSDMLVPIDQLTRAYTYDKPGDSVPEGYPVRLNPDYPGILGHSYEEEMNPGECWKTLVKYEDRNEIFNLPFNPDKMYSMVVIDDGPVEAWAGHHVSEGPGRLSGVNFLKEKMDATVAGTEMISVWKMHMLIERYMGRSLQLPAHENVCDDVYGSLKIYREEIVEGLAGWACAHSVRELNGLARSAAKMEAGRAARREYRKAWKEIRSCIGTHSPCLLAHGRHCSVNQ